MDICIFESQWFSYWCPHCKGGPDSYSVIGRHVGLDGYTIYLCKLCGKHTYVIPDIQAPYKSSLVRLQQDQKLSEPPVIVLHPKSTLSSFFQADGPTVLLSSISDDPPKGFERYSHYSSVHEDRFAVEVWGMHPAIKKVDAGSAALSIEEEHMRPAFPDIVEDVSAYVNQVEAYVSMVREVEDDARLADKESVRNRALGALLERLKTFKSDVMLSKRDVDKLVAEMAVLLEAARDDRLRAPLHVTNEALIAAQKKLTQQHNLFMAFYDKYVGD